MNYSKFYLGMLLGLSGIYGMINALEFGFNTFNYWFFSMFYFLAIIFTYLATKSKGVRE